MLWNLPSRAQPVDPSGLPSYGITNVSPYRVSVEHVGGPGLLPANFGYVSFGTNKFGFVLPEGFRLEPENPQKVTLVSADLNCLLTFRVLDSVPGSTTEPDAGYCRRLVLASHPGGKIEAEFSLAGASRRGPAFDVRWNAARGVPRRERVLFILSDAGILEFSLVSSLERFEYGRQVFSTFLTTFRIPEPNGRLVMPVFSDRL